MAAPKQKTTSVFIRHRKPRKKRPGIHSKKKFAKSKSSKNYKKPYRRQGR